MSGRDDLTPDMVTAFSGPKLRPVFFFEFAFDGASLRFFSGTGSIDWDGNTYTGAGNLLSVDLPEESAGIEARGATFQLSAIPESILSVALTENYQGRPVHVWLGAYDDNWQIIDSPVEIFTGFMDVIAIEDDPDNPVATLTAESDLIALRRPKVRRYTPEDQKMEYPDDLGLDFVPTTQDREIVWGK